MDIFKVTLFSFFVITFSIPNLDAKEESCKNSEGYTECKGQCISRYCPLENPRCQRAFNKCRPKCFNRHCGEFADQNKDNFGIMHKKTKKL